MAFNPAPGIMRVVMEFLQGGQQAVNVFHVHTNDTIGPGTCEDICITFRDWWDDNIRAYVSTGVSLVGVSARDMGFEAGAFFELTSGLPMAGELDSPVMPGNVTAVVSWGTGLTGRSSRGRTYHVGLTEVQCTGGLLTDAAVIALVAGYEELAGAIHAASVEQDFVVLSRFHNGVERDDPVWNNIVSAHIDNALDSQRRRLPGRGT